MFLCGLWVRLISWWALSKSRATRQSNALQSHNRRTLQTNTSFPPPLGGVFAQRGHSGDYPGNNPENHPPCGIMHNQFKTQKFKHLMLAMGPRDLNSAPYSPVHCSSHSMTSFQSSELTELPVVENSQLFAQRTVRPLTLLHIPEFSPASEFAVKLLVTRRENFAGMGGGGLRHFSSRRTSPP